MFFSSVQITINAHASVSYMLAALGINVVPTMPMIYLVFASLVCMTFVSVPFLPPAKMKWNRIAYFRCSFCIFSQFMELSKSAFSHPVHAAFPHLQEVSQSDATATSAP
jgi:hypothetical protein